MDTKLTLKLNQDIIEKAKIYASNKKISVSKLIENYLYSLTTSKEVLANIEISEFVKGLSTNLNIEVDYNYKKQKANFLEEKHK